MSVETMEETAVISLTEAAAEKLDGIMRRRACASRMRCACL
jgi:hypothetical protein